jgi:hypothetical protein
MSPELQQSVAGLPKAKAPFQFYTRLVLQELTGIRARGIKELLEYLRQAPESVIYHHTHRFLQQHQYLSPEPPNDFAYWIREMLGLDSLAEQMMSISPDEFRSLEAIRERFIAILENYLNKKERPRYAVPGQEFHFIKSVSFVFPSGRAATDLYEFVESLRQVTIESLYFHMFEAKLRLKRGNNDFSFWLGTSLGEETLAAQLERLDPYTHTMTALRETIIQFAQRRLAQLTRGSGG